MDPLAYGTVRVAVAGEDALAYSLCQAIWCLDNTSVHMIRRVKDGMPAYPRPRPTPSSWEYFAVNWQDKSVLRHQVMGVDLVISTISGEDQLALIKAARKENVKRFVPCQFEGSLARRQATRHWIPNDEWTRIRAALEETSTSQKVPMPYTVFSCGLLYEWWGPELFKKYGITRPKCLEDCTGTLFIDPETSAYRIIEYNSQGHHAAVVLTSSSDLVNFVCAAIGLGVMNWPQEFRMAGERMTLRYLIEVVAQNRGLSPSGKEIEYKAAVKEQRSSKTKTDKRKQLERLLAAADGRWDFADFNLNDTLHGYQRMFQTTSFNDWLQWEREEYEEELQQQANGQHKTTSKGKSKSKSKGKERAPSYHHQPAYGGGTGSGTQADGGGYQYGSYGDDQNHGGPASYEYGDYPEP